MSVKKLIWHEYFICFLAEMDTDMEPGTMTFVKNICCINNTLFFHFVLSEQSDNI